MENTTLAAPQGGAAESRTAEMLDAESEIYLGELAAFQSDARINSLMDFPFYL